MTTARTLINDARLEIGVSASGEAMPANEAKDALRVLNRMLQSWSTEDLMVYTIDRQTFPFVVGKQFYTLGTGGDLNTPRPVNIEMMSVLWGSAPAVEIPIKILTDDQWRDTSVKTVNSTFPLECWPNGNYPLNTLAFWPIPQANCTLVLYTWGQLGTLADLDTELSLPQGYEDAIVSNLAVRLAPQYGTQPSPITLALANQSKALIKRMNWEPTYRSVDAVLGGNGNLTTWNRSRGYVLE